MQRYDLAARLFEREIRHGKMTNTVVADYMAFINHPLNKRRIIAHIGIGDKEGSLLVLFFQHVEDCRRIAFFISFVKRKVKFLFLGQ